MTICMLARFFFYTIYAMDSPKRWPDGMCQGSGPETEAGREAVVALATEKDLVCKKDIHAEYTAKCGKRRLRLHIYIYIYYIHT